MQITGLPFRKDIWPTVLLRIIRASSIGISSHQWRDFECAMCCQMTSHEWWKKWCTFAAGLFGNPLSQDSGGRIGRGRGGLCALGGLRHFVRRFTEKHLGHCSGRVLPPPGSGEGPSPSRGGVGRLHRGRRSAPGLRGKPQGRPRLLSNLGLYRQ